MRLIQLVATYLGSVALGLLALPACSHAQSSPESEPTASGPAPAPMTGEPQVRVIPRHATAEASTDPSELSRSRLESRARERELGGRSYPLHEIPRRVRGKIDCPDVEIVEYAGTVIPYSQPIEVIPRFRSRLIRFEQIVRDVALEIYGRAPDEIVQLGGHNCRTIGGKGEKLSEHAFGHAIDVQGFNFEALDDGRDHDGPPRASGAFEVRLGKHWNAKIGFPRRHRRFLRRLATELTYRGPFSTMLGPGYPGHSEIFHFDFGPQFFFRLR